MREPKIPRALYDDLQIRFDDLQAKYHELVGEMLKRNPPPIDPVRIDFSENADDNFPVPDEVMDAIHLTSEPESEEANTVQEIAFGMLRQGMEVEDVVAAVHAGEDIAT